MIYYDANLNTFYDSAIHSVIPDNAKEIDKSLHTALLNQQAEGKQIQPDANGLPVAVIPEVTISPEEKAILVRGERNGKLRLSDWTALSDASLDPIKLTEWKNYRQALRDITQQPGFPDSITWPTEPV